MNESKGKTGKVAGLRDLEFWQSRSPSERMDAVWEMVLQSDSAEDLGICKLGLQKNIENYGKQNQRFSSVND